MSTKTEDKKATADVVDAKAEVVSESKNEIGAAAPRARVYEIDPEDIDIPWFNLVQKMSQIKGDLGDLILDKTAKIVGAETPIRVIPLKPIKGWKEDIDYDSDEVPRVAYTEVERDKLAAESKYKILEFAEVTFLVPAPDPENVDESVYMFPVGKTRYAVGRIYAQKDGFRMTYKRLKTFELYNTISGTSYTERVWTFESTLVEKGKYKWYAPSLRPTEEHTDPELLAFLKEFGG
jgi:hypothetical protein